MDIIITDSICCKVVSRDKLLVATGNRLDYVFLENGETRRERIDKIVLKDKIHGIEAKELGENTFRVLVFAGREIVTFLLQEPQKRNSGYSYLVQQHWISSVLLYEKDCFCLVTGHNVAVNYQVSLDGVLEIQSCCCCEDNSTLYCSKIVGSSSENLLIFSGTALGDLLIWKPFGEKKGNILHKVIAHKGVTFSIDCQLGFRLLTTTSDDRSVKFWDINLENMTDISLTEKCQCFGHTARVFSSKIIVEGNKIIVASIGEDSNLCVWDLKGNLLAKKRLHLGATIWGLDYDKGTKTIFTTASNGDANKFCISDILNENIQKEAVVATPNLPQDHFCKIKLMENGVLVGVTSKNCLYVQKRDSNLQLVQEIHNFKCSLLEVRGNEVFVAGKRFIIVYKVDLESNNFEILKEIEVENITIIRSLHFVEDQVIICDNNGKCLVYDNDLQDVKCSFLIPKCSERFVTSSLKHKEFYLIADRCGNLLLFKAPNIEPEFKLKNLHGNLGITSMFLSKIDDKNIFIKTTGHDGTVKTILLDQVSNKIELFHTEKTSVIWIEKFLKIEKKIFLLGFNDNHFVVYEKFRDIIFELDCGGGHRFWDIWHDTELNEIKFVFIQYKKVMKIQIKLENRNESILNVPKYDFHTKSCNAFKIVPIENNFISVSGGEDNILKIFDHENNKIINIYSHISNIKTICLKEIEDEKLLILSAGGRAQICLTILYKNGLTSKDELSYMLKSSDNERSRSGKNQDIYFDPETRFMCATILNGNKIYVGCSDGFIRIFSFKNKISCENEIYYGRCILNISSLKYFEENIILTMGTDGYVSFWSENSSAPFYQMKHHGSGVNCYDIREINSFYYLASGGDDQSVSLSRFKILQENCEFSLIELETISSAAIHIAQVTGIMFLNSFQLYSTSVDQKIYKINFESMKSLEIVKSFSSVIADIKGIVQLPNQKKFLVYGTGFEVFED